MYTQRIVVAFILLVLFGGTIIESSQSVTASVVIHYVKLEAMSFSTSAASQYQNVTYEGDLLVSSNDTFTIQNSEFYMIGKITVQDTSTLIMQNSKFTAMPIYRDSIVLKDQANLMVTNTTMISKSQTSSRCKLLVCNDAEVKIAHSALLRRWEIVAYNRSVVHVNNTTQQAIFGGDTARLNGIITYGTSTAEIENSTIESVFVSDDSTVSIRNSVVKQVRMEGRTSGSAHANNATVDIMCSTIESINALNGVPTLYVEDSTVTWRANFLASSSVQLTRSSIAELIAQRNTNVILIDCYAESIEARDNSRVFVGWDLPLFGLVTMHYTWVPIVQMIIVIAIIVAIITVLVLYKRRARRIQMEHAPVSGSKENLSNNYLSIM